MSFFKKKKYSLAASLLLNWHDISPNFIL